jgi:hypothetical protein
MLKEKTGKQWKKLFKFSEQGSFNLKRKYIIIKSNLKLSPQMSRVPAAFATILQTKCNYTAPQCRQTSEKFESVRMVQLAANVHEATQSILNDWHTISVRLIHGLPLHMLLSVNRVLHRKLWECNDSTKYTK